MFPSTAEKSLNIPQIWLVFVDVSQFIQTFTGANLTVYSGFTHFWGIQLTLLPEQFTMSEQVEVKGATASILLSHSQNGGNTPGGVCVVSDKYK